MNVLLLRVVESFVRENVCYCLLRGHDQLNHLTQNADVDLLVEGTQLARLHNLLTRFGFVKLSSRGYAPHHFFVAYDEPLDRWLKLDVVTEVAYGSPVHALRTDLGSGCLRNRRYREPIFVPAPEDELVTLLLHCVLDKGGFSSAQRQRLQTLCHEVSDEGYLSVLLTAYWSPAMTWLQLSAEIAAGNWTVLVAERPALAARLASRNRLGTMARKIRDRVLRTLNYWCGPLQPHWLTVALLAPDGAGKTTLAAGIEKTFYFPVRPIYMGLYQGGAGRLARLRVPGLKLVRCLLRQWWCYLRARYHQARGRLVIFDRYSYDALLPARQRLTWLVRGHRWLLAHALPAPDLVLVLDAPGEMLHARKGEHSVSVLEEQRRDYLELASRLSQMLVVDVTCDAEQLRRGVTALIWHANAHRLRAANWPFSIFNRLTNGSRT